MSPMQGYIFYKNPDLKPIFAYYFPDKTGNH